MRRTARIALRTRAILIPILSAFSLPWMPIERSALAAVPEAAGELAVPASAAEAALSALLPEIALACPCDSLRVRWRLGTGVEALIGEMKSTRAALLSVPGAAPAPSDACADRVTARIEGDRGGSHVQTLVAGDLLCRGTGHRALASIRRGEVIEAGRLSREEGWIPPSAVWTSRTPCGQYTVGAVAEGDWVRPAGVRTPPWVRRGEPIVIAYEIPGLVLEGRGAAREDAWEGERVLVRLEGAARDCQAIVVAPGKARVRSEGGLP